MNCKQDDLAIVVRSDAGNEGKIVRCLRLVSTTGLTEDEYGIPYLHPLEGPVWQVDQKLDSFIIYPATQLRIWLPCTWIEDTQLRPIKDFDPDELIETDQLDSINP